MGTSRAREVYPDVEVKWECKSGSPSEITKKQTSLRKKWGFLFGSKWWARAACLAENIWLTDLFRCWNQVSETRHFHVILWILSIFELSSKAKPFFKEIVFKNSPIRIERPLINHAALHSIEYALSCYGLFEGIPEYKRDGCLPNGFGYRSDFRLV